MDSTTALIAGALFGLGLLVAALAIFITRGSRTQQFEQALAGHQRRVDLQSKTIQDQRTSLQEIGQELQRLKILLLTFPDLAKELSSSVNTKEFEETIVKITHQLFDARTTVLFSVEDTRLQLTAHRGLSLDGAQRLQRLSIGEGQIGWVAKKQIIMTAQDLQQESGLVRSQLQQQGPGIPAMDVCAPLIHRERLYGVLAVAGIAQKKDFVKPLMMVVANLGVVAMENISLIGEIQKQSDMDSLTQLYNAIYFYKYLDREMQKGERYQRPFSIVVFDLDNFKRYNNQFGHHEGDQILRVIGELIKKDLRTVDIPCRYGGEEFAVILPETSTEQAQFVADRTRRVIEDYRFSFAKMTVSGGGATYPYHATTPTALLQVAEKALEKAKCSGHNQIVAYSSSNSKKA